MADEFDLKPTSRGEEFLDVILRSLGGDTPDIPQPAWRYEEYLAAIANAIQNGGGGSSGGGVLMVHPDDDTEALDKTWQEIHDAGAAFLVFGFGNNIETSVLTRAGKDFNGKYYVTFCALVNNLSNAHYSTYQSDTADGYPVYTE